MSSDKSAIERLRALLNERGVKHVGGGGMTKWTSEDGCVCRAYSRPGHLTVDVAIMDASPEQAVAATLGRVTCHDTGGTDENGQQVFNCDACGCVLSLCHRDGTNTMCTHYIYDYPRFCPNCGRRIVEVEG